MKQHKSNRGLAVLMLLGATALLSACLSPRGSLDAYVEKMKAERPEFYAKLVAEDAIRESQRTAVQHVSISCFNHGDYGASSFAVEEVAFGQMGRGMVGGPFGCGGDLGLGYPLPLKWRPGLKVRVQWNTYAPGATEPTRHEQSTTIRPYHRLGSVYVHFYPGDQVRIVVSDYYGVGHPLHPLAEDDLTPPPEIE